jgi:tRNA wybutosine-synthesizing protein 4
LPSGYDSVILIGGVVNDRLLPYENEITVWNASRGTVDPAAETPGLGSRNAPAERRALLVGHSALITEADQMVILGGGATCFSMGTYWNKGPYTLDVSFSDNPVDALKMQYLQTVEILPGDRSNGALGEETQGLSAPEITSIPQVTIQSAADFEGILRNGQPVVLKGLSLGPCVGRWDLNYISDKAGPERKVSYQLLSLPPLRTM